MEEVKKKRGRPRKNPVPKIPQEIKDKAKEIISEKSDYPDYYKIGSFVNSYMTYDLDYSGKDLTLDEASMLAGIPNAPSVYSPNVNPDLAKKRQLHVLNKMVENGYISQEEADKIK